MAGLSSKGSCGRTQMLMVQATDARHDAFFKRNFSLYKKATELCTLCALENVLVVLSLGGKPFFIGKPGVYTSVYSFPSCRMPDFDEIDCAKAEEEATLLRHIGEASDHLEKLEAKNILVEQLIKATMENQRLDQDLVDKLVDELNVEELLALETMIDEYMKTLRKRMNELRVEVAASTLISSGEGDASLGRSGENDSSADVDEH